MSTIQSDEPVEKALEWLLMAHNDLPTFNLKVVLNETGLKADTIRAWERRYGLPQPDRSGGGHRLYSEHDIQVLKWLMNRQREGLSISRAAELWHRLVSDGTDPLARPLAGTTRPHYNHSRVLQGEAVSTYREEWISACLAFDEERAEQVLSEAFALYPSETVCFEVLQNGLSQIGEGWQRAEVTVQQEHFASALATRRLHSLIVTAVPATSGERILIACPPDEEHVFGALLITFLLKRHGWDVLYLGANVPISETDLTIQATRPRLSILSAQRLSTAASLVDLAAPLSQHGVMIAYGGWIFSHLPSLRARMPGYFLGESLQDLPDAVEELMKNSSTPYRPEPVTAEYRQALTDFITWQPLIDRDILGSSTVPSGVLRYLNIANYHFARSVLAGLKLGDISLASIDIQWLSRLLSSRSIPDEALDSYLQSYSHAALSYLSPAHPLIPWLSEVRDSMREH